MADGYGPFSGYTPIETKADRWKARGRNLLNGLKEIVGIEGTVKHHLSHRLHWVTVGKEVFNHFTEKVIPHGADEVGNVLYSSSAYLPWPGSAGPEPIPVPETISMTESASIGSSNRNPAGVSSPSRDFQPSPHGENDPPFISPDLPDQAAPPHSNFDKHAMLYGVTIDDVISRSARSGPSHDHGIDR